MIATRPGLFAGPGTACGLPEPRAAGLAQTSRGCFRFKCELNEEKNVSLGNSIGARSSDRCCSLLSHRACILSSRIANYFRVPATAKEEKEVAGVALGGVCCQAGAETRDPCVTSLNLQTFWIKACPARPCPLGSVLCGTLKAQQSLLCQHCFV